MLRTQTYPHNVVPKVSREGRAHSRRYAPHGPAFPWARPERYYAVVYIDRGCSADFLSQANAVEKMTGGQLHLFADTGPVGAHVAAGREKAESSCSLEPIFPPAAPWTELEVATPATGYLSVYLSEDLSRLPIRAITRPNDNKSDPNIETGTYGLFSTCERGMRAGIVNNRARFIIFLSKRDKERVVAGYYRLAWKTEGIWHATKRDYALAADYVHFVTEPIPVSQLPEPVKGAAERKFRLSKRLNAVETQTIIAALDSRPNALENYLSEIDRVERFQAFHSGFRYASWQQREPFSWELARQYLVEPNALGTGPNQSPTGFWQCTNSECGKFINNWSLLRRCPFCSAMGTLQVVANLEGPFQ